MIKKMLNGNAMVVVSKREEVTKGGLILSTNIESNVKNAIVKYKDNLGVTEVGDNVTLPFHSGVEMEYEGENVLLINVNSDILFID